MLNYDLMREPEGIWHWFDIRSALMKLRRDFSDKHNLWLLADLIEIQSPSWNSTLPSSLGGSCRAWLDSGQSIIDRVAELNITVPPASQRLEEKLKNPIRKENDWMIEIIAVEHWTEVQSGSEDNEKTTWAAGISTDATNWNSSCWQLLNSINNSIKMGNPTKFWWPN